MQTQRKELNFEGQSIFVGIDVHLKVGPFQFLQRTYFTRHLVNLRKRNY